MRHDLVSLLRIHGPNSHLVPSSWLAKALHVLSSNQEITRLNASHEALFVNLLERRASECRVEHDHLVAAQVRNLARHVGMTKCAKPSSTLIEQVGHDCSDYGVRMTRT